MNAVHMVVGIAAMALTAAAALLGAWGWWRVQRTQLFWWLLRGGQATIVLTVLLGAVDDLGHHKAPGLHVLYGVLPMLVSLIAEQLRASAAQMVLDARDFQSAADVGKLPEDEQQVIVLSILQREVAVMTLAAIVNVVLLARAAATA